VHKSHYILNLIFLVATTANGQSVEIGGMLGVSNYHGDLAYNIVPQEGHFSGGVFTKINFNEFWTMRPTLSYMRISGDDQNFKEYNVRNLSFRNDIYEISNVMELNFQPFSNKHTASKTTFYGMAGIAVFIHKPQAFYNDEWVDLRSVRTESKSYNLLQVSVPFGAGIKHSVTDNIIFGFEAGWRKTFTDYLDDVSTVYPYLNAGTAQEQLSDRSGEVSGDGRGLASAGDTRGDPNLKDWYFQTAFTISYRFTPIQCPF
jgi:hypothetical protein